MLAEPERRRGGANLVDELLLRDQALRLRLYELIRVVVMLEHVELDLGLRDIEAGHDGLLEAGLRVRKVLIGVLRVSEDAEMSTTCVLSVLLRDRMQVEHRPAGDEKLMHVAQGVHDALTFDSSQGPGEEREIEAPPWSVDLGRADGGEGDVIREVDGQSLAGNGDLVGVGIDRENACSGVRVAKGQPAVSTPELEHTEPSKTASCASASVSAPSGSIRLGTRASWQTPPSLSTARPAATCSLANWGGAPGLSQVG